MIDRAQSVSKILDWYKADFVSAGAAKYLAQFIKDPAKKAALLKATKVDFLPYNWTLNRETR